MEYLPRSTPPRKLSPRPHPFVQSNVVPELHLSASPRRQTDLQPALWDQWPETSRGIRCDGGRQLRHSLSNYEERTTRKPEIYNSTHSKSSPSLKISVKQPLFGHIYLADLNLVEPYFDSCNRSDENLSSSYSTPSCPSMVSSTSDSPPVWYTESHPGQCRLNDFVGVCPEEIVPIDHSVHVSRSQTSLPIHCAPRLPQKYPRGHSSSTRQLSYHHADWEEKHLSSSCRENKSAERSYLSGIKENKDFMNRKQQCQLFAKSSSPTEHTFRLSDLISHSDPHTRDQAIIMARWFRRWQTNVQTRKMSLKRDSPQIYQAFFFDRSATLTKFFRLWRSRLRRNHNVGKAADLQRHHLLRKAMRALQWAVSQGVGESEVAIRRRNQALLRRFFTSWKEKVERRDRIKWHFKFIRWRRDSELRIRLQQYKESRERMIVCRAFSMWKSALREARNNSLAENFNREQILVRAFHNWQLVAAERRVKRLQKSLSKITFDRKLKAQVFFTWLTIWRDWQRAKAFNRRTVVSRVLAVWRSRYSDHKDRVDRSLRVADQYRALSLTLTVLNLWRRRLLEVKVQHIYELKTLRKYWLLWRQCCQIKSYQRAQGERLQKLNILLRLKLNVHISKQRRQAACCVIETVLTRRVLHRWMEYYQRKSLERFAMKRQEKLLKIQGLKKLEIEMKAISKYLLLKWAFHRWINEKLQSKYDATFAENVRRELKTSRTRRVWTVWVSIARRSSAIKSLSSTIRRKRLLQAVRAWRAVIARKQKYLAYLEYRRAQRMMITFLTWRIHYLSRVQTAECDKIWSRSLLKMFCHRWVYELRMRTLSLTFRRMTLLRQAWLTWVAHFQANVQTRLDIQNAQRMALMRRYFARLQEQAAKKRKNREFNALARESYENHLKQQALTRWKYYYEERTLSDVPCDVHALPLSEFPRIQAGQTIRYRVLRNCLEKCWKFWSLYYIQTRATQMFYTDKLYKRYFRQWRASVEEQKQRENQLTQQIHRRQRLKYAFEKWQLRLIGLGDLQLKVDQFRYHTTTPTKKRFWKMWRQSFMLSRRRKAELSVKRKAFSVWIQWTREKSERALRGRALKRAIRNRGLKYLFVHWKHRYLAHRLEVSFEDGLLMTGSFENWFTLVAHFNMLEDLAAMFVSTQTKACLWKSFTLWRDSLHWNQILAQSQRVLEHQQKLRLKKAFFRRWNQKYQETAAEKHYSRFLKRKFLGLWKTRSG